MTEVFSSPAAFVALTFIVYALSLQLYKKLKLFILHPVLVSAGLLMCILLAAGISYEEYNRGGIFITSLLSPSVVAFGVSLYRETGKIRKQAGAIFVTTLFGSLAGIISAVIPALLLGLPREVLVSLAPKSVTTPIAMEITAQLGGIPPLAAIIVIFTGILGAVIGPAVLNLLCVTEESAFGLAMGFSAHGIGTAQAFEKGDAEGAFSSLGLCLNGLATSILTPLIISLILR